MIYLDNAATTPLLSRVKEAIIYNFDNFGNPSSIHEAGNKAKDLLEEARVRIAKCINAKPHEIIFTSGGTESNNFALDYYGPRGRRPLVSNCEHHSVADNPVVRNLGEYIGVNPDGIVTPEALKARLKETYFPFAMISIMAVNNEIGTINPIKQLAKIAHEHNVVFHTDAVAACGYMPIDVKAMGIDVMSIAGHKFGAPKGIGALYISEDVRDKYEPILYGGPQESGLRAGTENVLGAYAMAVALDYMNKHKNQIDEELNTMKDYIEDSLLSIPGTHINCKKAPRCNHIISVRFDDVDAETLVLTLSSMGVAVSAKSACSSSDGIPSHVLKAIGLTDEQASSTIRISLGPTTTMSDVYQGVDKIERAVTFLREKGMPNG